MRLREQAGSLDNVLTARSTARQIVLEVLVFAEPVMYSFVRRINCKFRPAIRWRSLIAQMQRFSRTSNDGLFQFGIPSKKIFAKLTRTGLYHQLNSGVNEQIPCTFSSVARGGYSR